MEALLGKTTGPCVEFSQAAESLMSDYLGRMRDQLSDWMEKNFVLESAKYLRDETGALASTMPNDMVRLLRVQLSTAQQYLEPIRFILALGPAAASVKSTEIMFSEKIHDTDRAIRGFLAAQELLQAKYPPSVTTTAAEAARAALERRRETLTAVEGCVGFSNDLLRLSTLVQEYRDELEGVIDASKIEGLGISVAEALSTFDDVSAEFLDFAIEMSQVAALSAAGDVHTVMVQLFREGWACSSSPLAETISRTMQDWLKDVSKWMDDFLFPRFIHRCAQLVLHQYILRLADLPLFTDAKSPSAASSRPVVNFRTAASVGLPSLSFAASASGASASGKRSAPRLLRALSGPDVTSPDLASPPLSPGLELEGVSTVQELGEDDEAEDDPDLGESQKDRLSTAFSFARGLGKRTGSFRDLSSPASSASMRGDTATAGSSSSSSNVFANSQSPRSFSDFPQALARMKEDLASLVEGFQIYDDALSSVASRTPAAQFFLPISLLVDILEAKAPEEAESHLPGLLEALVKSLSSGENGGCFPSPARSPKEKADFATRTQEILCAVWNRRPSGHDRPHARAFAFLAIQAISDFAEAQMAAATGGA